jgi:uncharacterized repeat protein (TIGR01451 family)
MSSSTLVFSIPYGFEFDTTSNIAISFTQGRDITSASVGTRDSSRITIIISTDAAADQSDNLFIDNIRVRPLRATPLAAQGNIYRRTSDSGNAVIIGIVTTDDSTGSGRNVTNFGTLTQVAGRPYSIRSVSGGVQSAPVNSPFLIPLSALVEDSARNPVQGESVTFRAPGSGASCRFGPNLTDTAITRTGSNGVATAPPCTANTIRGRYDVSARVAGVVAAASFSLNNLAGHPKRFSDITGIDDSATVTQLFPRRFQLVVRDTFNNPVPNIMVAFAPPTSGASGTFSSSVTSWRSNDSGFVQADPFRANTIAGRFQMSIQDSGRRANASFPLHNLAGPLAHLIRSSPELLFAAIETQFDSSLRVQVTDQFFNPKTGLTVTFAAPTNKVNTATCFWDGSQNTSISKQTDSSGFVRASARANSYAGYYEVRVSIAHLTITFTLTNLAGHPVRTVFMNPVADNLIAGRSLNTISVRLKDRAGNNVPSSGRIVRVRLISGSGRLRGDTTAQTNADGIAIFSNLRINLGGSLKKLQASSDTLQPDETSFFTLLTKADVQCSLSVRTSNRDVLTFLIQAKNSGPSDITSNTVVVRDTLKSGLRFTNDSVRAVGWTFSRVADTVIEGRYTTEFSASNDSVKTIEFNARFDTSGIPNAQNSLLRTTAVIIGEGTDSIPANNVFTLPPLTLRRVRPGDTDNDGQVSARDVIPIAISLNQSGPPRWGQPDTVEQFVPFGWPESDSISVRADCNGNGRVDTSDIGVIVKNWGRTTWSGGPEPPANPISRDEVLRQLLNAVNSMAEGEIKRAIISYLNSQGFSQTPLPTEWSLQQNYPNPFNGETTIRYSVPKDVASVKISIYDLLGRKVNTFERSDVRRGNYDFRWGGVSDKGESVASGVYLYRLEVPVATPIRKLLYLR